MPDALPFRLRVLRAITDMLKTITPANGYVSDLSDFVNDDGATIARVYRGRTRFGFGDPRPMVSVLEHPRALEQLHGTEGSTSRTGGWDLLIQGFVQDDPDHPTDPGHILVADVIKAFAAEMEKTDNLFGFGNLKPCVSKIEIGGQVVRPEDEDLSDIAYFFLTVTLTLVEDLKNPFAQTPVSPY